MHLPNREHTITADVEIAADGVAEGILLAMGSALGGFASTCATVAPLMAGRVPDRKPSD